MADIVRVILRNLHDVLGRMENYQRVPLSDRLRRVPMADILGVIFRTLNDVLRHMENYHEVPLSDDVSFIRRINTLKRVIADHFRQSYGDRAYQGQGKRIKDGHHQSMARLLHEISASNSKYCEALFNLLRQLDVFKLDPVPHLGLDLNLESELLSINSVHHLERWINKQLQPHLMFLGNRRIRRRNKQRWRRAIHRVTLAKVNLVSCIRDLIFEAMLYHLICSIEMAQGRSSEFSVVSEEIDVTVIEVMISLFPRKRYQVTSYIDLIGRFRHYHVEPGIQDGDEPQKYRLTRPEIYDDLMW